MKYSYGWSYANAGAAVAPKKTRARRENRRVRKLRLDTRANGEMAGRTGRMLVALTLVALSLVVLGKEEALRLEAERMVAGWAATLRQFFMAAEREAAAPVPAPAAAQAKPLALISDKGLFVLDEKGGLWPLSASLPADLPVLTGLTVREEPGNLGVVLRSNVDRDLLSRLLAVPYQAQLSEIHWGEPEGLVLYTRDGVKVWLDPGPSLDRDLRRLGAVLGDIWAKRKQIAVVDLRYDQQVVVRPKSAPSALRKETR